MQLLFGKLADGVMSRVVVHVGEKNRLGEGWLDVFARAPVSVTASTNLAFQEFQGNVRTTGLEDEEFESFEPCSRTNSSLGPVPYRRCLPDLWVSSSPYYLVSEIHAPNVKPWLMYEFKSVPVLHCDGKAPEHAVGIW